MQVKFADFTCVRFAEETSGLEKEDTQKQYGCIIWFNEPNF